MSPEYILTISRLAKSYRAGVLGCTATVDVLRGLSLKLRAAQFATIEGARGSGKSTLLLCAAGMLRPDEGEIRWPGLPQRPIRPPAGIAYAANRAPMYGFLTVRESVAYAATVRELHEPGVVRDGQELLEIARLTDQAEMRVGLLTAPERSRLLVALALIPSPRLLLVDDLCDGHDAVGRAEFVKCLARVASSGVAVVWAGRAIGAVSDASASYTLAGGRLRRAGASRYRTPRRVSIELDVPAPAVAAAMLAPRLRALPRTGELVRVPLDGRSAEEVLSLCKELSIPVLASRIVRETEEPYNQGTSTEERGTRSEGPEG